MPSTFPARRNMPTQFRRAGVVGEISPGEEGDLGFGVTAIHGHRDAGDSVSGFPQEEF